MVVAFLIGMYGTFLLIANAFWSDSLADQEFPTPQNWLDFFTILAGIVCGAVAWVASRGLTKRGPDDPPSGTTV